MALLSIKHDFAWINPNLDFRPLLIPLCSPLTNSSLVYSVIPHERVTLAWLVKLNKSWSQEDLQGMDDSSPCGPISCHKTQNEVW
jgi:hypothetical protein